MSDPTMQTREIVLDRGAVSGDRVALSFSSEQPVTRTDWETGTAYSEILDHSPGNVDLSRLSSGAHPFLVNHDTNDQIGVVEQATVGPDKKGRAMVRFSKSARGREILADVQSGIRTLVSVGYRLGKKLDDAMQDGVRTVRFAWQPFEISLVSIPADTSVGVGRSQITQSNRTFMNQENQNEISAIAERLSARCPEVRKLADHAIVSNMPLEQFRERALSLLPQCQPVRAAAPLEDVRPSDWNKYSLTRAMKSLCENGKLSGMEGEFSRELALQTGRAPGGFWVPPQAFAAGYRSFVAATGTLGGMLVQTDNLAAQFIEVLRNKSQVLNLGARVLSLNNPVTIPRQNAAGTANWVGETVAATLSDGNFTQITLTPQAVSAFQQYSKQLLFESNPSIDAIIRDDITAILGLAIDLAALHGTGSGQPTGIANTSGVGTVLLATNGLGLNNSTAYPAMVSLESVVASGNADMGSLAYLMRPAHRSTLRTQQRFTNTDSPVFKDGKVVDYRAEVSNQVAANLTTGTATTITSAIFFGNWNDVLVGNFNGGAIDLTVDPYTLAVNGVVRIIARQWVDVGLRHPASFAILGGIL